MPKDVITIAQLQTLLNDTDIIKRNPAFQDYSYKKNIESIIINNVDYIGTIAKKYRDIIRKNIAPKAILLNTSLALTEPIFRTNIVKCYDFVYFAANIKKAADLAVEAFGKAYQQYPSITLNIIGSYELEYKRRLDNIISEYHIENAVTFEGALPSHEDVLNHIRKARYALLPLRGDLVSGTIREAMSNGLPVITTDTGELGTQTLNKKRQNVLISPIGDHQALADNMMRLLNDKELADSLRSNAYQTRSEVKSNEAIIRQYVKTYNACIENYRKHSPLPAELTEI